MKLIGKIIILSMFFISCKTSNPYVVEKFKEDGWFDKTEIIEFVSSLQKAEEIGSNPLIMVDDTPNYEYSNLESLIEETSKNKIVSLRYLSKDKSIKLFGKVGVDGTVKMNTY